MSLDDSRAYDKTMSMVKNTSMTILRTAFRFTKNEVAHFMRKKQEIDRAIKSADNPEKVADEFLKNNYGLVLDGGDGFGGKVGIEELKGQGFIDQEQYHEILSNITKLCHPDNKRDISLDEKAVRAALASTYADLITTKYAEYEKTGDKSVFNDLVEKSASYNKVPSYIMMQKDRTLKKGLSLDEKLAQAKVSSDMYKKVTDTVKDIGKQNENNIKKAVRAAR